jgi:hypothetical protein
MTIHIKDPIAPVRIKKMIFLYFFLRAIFVKFLTDLIFVAAQYDRSGVGAGREAGRLGG